MKRTICILMICLLAAALSACSKEKEPLSEELAGAWKINEDLAEPKLSEETEAAFTKALEGYTGQSFEIIALLGSQVVSGTNYLFLCKATSVTADPVISLKAVKVYADLKGNCEVKSVKDVEITDYLENNDTGDGSLFGAFAYDTDQNLIDALPLKKALEGFTGASYSPVALLASQQVDGINYAYLAVETLVIKDPYSLLSIVSVYEDALGNSKITSVYNLDLAELAD